jgi:hypothetical protein
MDPDILLVDGFEEALIGTVQIFSKTIALYDREKCIKILIDRDGMERDDAEEYFQFNVTGAFMGEHTPAFATFFEKPCTRRVSKRRGRQHPVVGSAMNIDRRQEPERRAEEVDGSTQKDER